MNRVWITSTIALVVFAIAAISEGEEKPSHRQFEFGVGTFRVRVGEQVRGWVSVNGDRTQEIWIFHEAWANGLARSAAVTFEFVDDGERMDPAAFKAWITGNNASQFPGGGLHPMAHRHAVSPVDGTPASPANPPDGLGTFRVLDGRKVTAWVTIRSNYHQIWMFDDSWSDIRADSAFCFEEAITDKSFDDAKQLHHWIDNNRALSKYDGSGLQATVAREHVVTEVPLP